MKQLSPNCLIEINYLQTEEFREIRVQRLCCSNDLCNLPWPPYLNRTSPMTPYLPWLFFFLLRLITISLTIHFIYLIYLPPQECKRYKARLFVICSLLYSQHLRTMLPLRRWPFVIWMNGKIHEQDGTLRNK